MTMNNNRPPLGTNRSTLGINRPQVPVSKVQGSSQVKPVQNQEISKASLPSLVEVPNDNIIRKGLEGLVPVLNYVGYKSFYRAADKEVPFEQLFVSSVYEGNELEIEDSPLIQLLYTTDVAKAIDSEINEENDSSNILQFFVSLPTTNIEAEKKLRIHELLSVMSKLLPIGYLSYNEIDGVIYRYSVVTPTKELDDLVIIEIIEMISFFITNSYHKIKLFVGTNLSYDEIIEQFEKGFIDSSRIG